MSIQLDKNNLPPEIELKAYNAAKIYHERFGKLEALYPYGKSPDGRTLWVCKCDCGNYCGVTVKNLRQNVKPTRSCGCLRKENARIKYNSFKDGDILGNGIKILKRGDAQSEVECLYCHKIYSLTNSYLNSIKENEHTSCGCQKGRFISQSKIKDLTGQKIDYLTVLETYDQIINGSALNKCQCECGKILYLTSAELQWKSSCGCKRDRISKGEKYIRNLLENNYNYIIEYSFPDLRGEKFPLRFDFALFDNQQLIGLIEVNGRQHYEEVDIFGGNEEFIKRQEYDKKKKEYCEINHIPLFIIPYTEVFNTTINDIKEFFNYGEKDN